MIFVGQHKYWLALICCFLSEGQTVHLPAPKSHYTRDITLEKDIPIFCTGKQPLVYISGGSVDERETEMMSVR